jgi:hypothetical protein
MVSEEYASRAYVLAILDMVRKINRSCKEKRQFNTVTKMMKSKRATSDGLKEWIRSKTWRCQSNTLRLLDLPDTLRLLLGLNSHSLRLVFKLSNLVRQLGLNFFVLNF